MIYIDFQEVKKRADMLTSNIHSEKQLRLSDDKSFLADHYIKIALADLLSLMRPFSKPTEPSEDGIEFELTKDIPDTQPLLIESENYLTNQIIAHWLFSQAEASSQMHHAQAQEALQKVRSYLNRNHKRREATY